MGRQPGWCKYNFAQASEMTHNTYMEALADGERRINQFFIYINESSSSQKKKKLSGNKI